MTRNGHKMAKLIGCAFRFETEFSSGVLVRVTSRSHHVHSECRTYSALCQKLAGRPSACYTQWSLSLHEFAFVCLFINKNKRPDCTMFTQNVICTYSALCQKLKSVLFKKTVARISFLSKLWYFQYKSKQKVPQF